MHRHLHAHLVPQDLLVRLVAQVDLVLQVPVHGHVLDLQLQG